MTELEKYIQYLETKGVSLVGIHWVSGKPEIVKDCRSKMKKLFMNYASMEREDHLTRICSKKGCLNPLHYQITKTPRYRSMSETDILDMEEIAGLIEIRKLTELGFESYLAYFNHDNPLPVERNIFYYACNIALKNNRKRLLPMTILMGEKND